MASVRAAQFSLNLQISDNLELFIAGLLLLPPRILLQYFQINATNFSLSTEMSMNLISSEGYSSLRVQDLNFRKIVLCTNHFRQYSV
jgi:hypothetical protein